MAPTIVKAHDVSTVWHGMVPRLLREHGSKRVAEIGVWRGTLSQKILERCPEVEQLVLIDSWEPVYANDPVHGWMVFGPGTDTKEMADAYRTVCEMAAPYGARVIVAKLPSVEAAKAIPDHWFDAILIDALHTYHACKADILAWWPKLRRGGVMIGDDYSEWFPGVQIAVEEIFGAKHCVLDQTWWVVKGEQHVAGDRATD